MRVLARVPDWPRMLLTTIKRITAIRAPARIFIMLGVKNLFWLAAADFFRGLAEISLRYCSLSIWLV